MATQSMQDLMARAKAVAEARKNRPAESFWPNVKNWLVSHQGNQPLPTCPICYTELDVQGIDSVPSLDATPASASSPSADGPSPSPFPFHDQSTCDAEGMASVLPCGHMVCHNCILTTMEEMTADDSALCPVCRTSCCDDDDNDTCGHKVHYHVATAETNDPNWIERIPLTIPEGGRIPERCWACATYLHINQDCFSDDEEFDPPATEVTWDLLSLEDKPESQEETVVPSWRNVPSEGVEDTAESNALGGASGISFAPPSPPSSPAGDGDDAPFLFGEVRTARPLNGRVMPNHCCYYDSIFRDFHRWLNYDSSYPSQNSSPELWPLDRD